MRLDGEPAPGAVVMQPGFAETWVTDVDGWVDAKLRYDVTFEVWLTASHPLARIDAVRLVQPGDTDVIVDLFRYENKDNADYTFQDPGSPFRNDSTEQCAHCHLTINEDWYGSAHAGSASSTTVFDLYAGTSRHEDASSCEAAGGQWTTSLIPGGEGTAPACFVGPGALLDVNPSCGPGEACAGGDHAGCADCHAPGIDGALGGRALHDATGVAFEAGVHCDVCHKVESVHLDAPPGVAGRLRILRPSELSPSPALGEFLPITFGPHHDVPNPRMGSVQREHFREATLCAGCHEDVHAPRVPGATIDLGRWPDGRLPIQTTYSEWLAGPLGGSVPCQSCHMPPDPRVLNGADLQEFELYPGSGDLTSGWPRPFGAVRRHTFVGPRSTEGNMLELSAHVSLRAEADVEGIVVHATVSNVGPGHALPTGEPMRHLVLRVLARCGDTPLPAVGGDAIPDFGGALEVREADQGWDLWPDARPGDRIRVISRPGGYHDAPGTGPFGDGTFTPEQKGLPIERVVGESVILAVEPDGAVSLDVPLAEGDLAYRVDDEGWVVDGAPARAAAGGPGFAFSRLTVDIDGHRQVAAHRAVDIVSDNRLPPGGAWTSIHQFSANGCAAPTVGAQLLWRAYPVPLARQKGWDNPERLLVETWRPL